VAQPAHQTTRDQPAKTAQHLVSLPLGAEVVVEVVQQVQLSVVQVEAAVQQALVLNLVLQVL
jgi:hypothetical protein